MKESQLVAAALAAVLLLAGCTPSATQPSAEPTNPSAASSAPQSALMSPSTPTAIDATTTSPSATPSAQCPRSVPLTLPVSKGALPSGKSFAFVHHFDGTALYVDPAEFLDGKAALAAAREDGVIGPHDDLSEPFYIRNRSTAIVRVPVSASLRITVLASRGGSPMPEKRSAAELAALYCGGPRPDWLYSDPLALPVIITVANGEVTQVHERYLP